MVIGGGYIGVEMAENLVEAGLKVAIVELADHLIAPLDFDMAADVHRYIKSKGVYLHLNNGVKTINGNTVILQNGEITADMIILSVGVRPETAIAKDCGIELNPRGSIVVNNKCRPISPMFMPWAMRSRWRISSQRSLPLFLLQDLPISRAELPPIISQETRAFIPARKARRF